MTSYGAPAGRYPGSEDPAGGPFPSGSQSADYGQNWDARYLPDERTGSEKPCRTLFVRNISFGTKIKAMRERFEHFGEIKTFFELIARRGIVFVHYFDIRAAAAAKEQLHGQFFDGRPVDIHYSLPREEDKAKRCDRDKNQGTLFTLLKQTPQRLSDDDFRQVFGQYGEIRSVRAYKNMANARFVEFFDSRACQMANDTLNGQVYRGGEWDVKFAWDLPNGDEMRPAPPLPAPAHRAGIAAGSESGGHSAHVIEGGQQQQWPASSTGGGGVGVGQAPLPPSGQYPAPSAAPATAFGAAAQSPGAWGTPPRSLSGASQAHFLSGPPPTPPTPSALPSTFPHPPSGPRSQQQPTPPRSASVRSASSPPPPTQPRAFGAHFTHQTMPMATNGYQPDHRPHAPPFASASAAAASTPTPSSAKPAAASAAQSPSSGQSTNYHYGRNGSASFEPAQPSTSVPLSSSAETIRLEQAQKVQQLLASLGGGAKVAAAAAPMPPASSPAATAAPPPVSAAPQEPAVPAGLPAGLAALLAQASAASTTTTTATPPASQPVPQAPTPAPAQATPPPPQGHESMQTLLKLLSQARGQKQQ
ncbi:uncharacterized protein PFL1_01533 [Pseudozyma flocculosa PF-1]|uniref:uncharacterized protein n=1 Tax=Pseudozyma flocculosa PF-1 TaxID=1277687 RepID=UPI00045611A5|nr:uncharacterized protein PFL1_01533 [Pseudozyma flocculosa PF-1]EPQ30632.1 hypothetical protein PFL1_01533 [Pseudozyma flocculosa PF-1]